MSSEKTPKWKKQGLVGPGGAWATAKRKAKAAGKGDDYASAIYARMTGKKARPKVPTESAETVIASLLVKSRRLGCG